MYLACYGQHHVFVFYNQSVKIPFNVVFRTASNMFVCLFVCLFVVVFFPSNEVDIEKESN